jgi:hypothetical protein
MKRIDGLARNALVGFFALGLAFIPASGRAESIPQVVQVVKVEGSAQYSTDGRTWQNLHEGDVLNPGAVIRTAEKSVVDVMLGEEGSAGGSFTGPNLQSIPGGGAAGAGGDAGGAGGGSEEQRANIVRIFQSTVMGVDKLTLDRTGVDEVSETQLDLRAGQIMMNVKKLSKDSRFEIKVPNGVAGIKGSGGIITSPFNVKWFSGSLQGEKVLPDGTLFPFTLGAWQQFDSANNQVSTMSDLEKSQYASLFDSLQPPNVAGPSTVTKFINLNCISPENGLGGTFHK